MADTLEDLAARCESAAGPHRELDVSIADAMTHYAGWHEPFSDVCAPAFTASLDAATTLVPERWMRFDVDATAPELGIDWTLHGRKEEVKATAATPALALCAASLRAIAKERG